MEKDDLEKHSWRMGSDGDDGWMGHAWNGHQMGIAPAMGNENWKRGMVVFAYTRDGLHGTAALFERCLICDTGNG